MCCFSVATPVGLFARLLAKKVQVEKTNIFARRLDSARQVLAYGMNLDSGREVAMVLPLPVAPGAGADAVRFIDLSATPRMFDELAELFVFAPPQAKGGGPLRSRRPDRLIVHQVGAFVASYVPTRADFSRLDAQFQLPDVLFDAVPHYADYGFAVFQLKPGKVTVHPMALEFPTRTPDQLFFPTVHVHDGRFHATAKFDHALYYQHPRAPAADAFPLASFAGDAVSWTGPRKPYSGIVNQAQPVVRRTLRARLPNADTFIAAT